jgi:hypothetical protein
VDRVRMGKSKDLETSQVQMFGDKEEEQVSG